jgi:hypothetical protein
MKKSTIIKFIIVLIIVMIAFWGILNYLKNRNNEVLEKVEYNYFVLFQNEKMGVIDREANIIIEPEFDNIIIPNPAKDVFLCSNNEEKNKYLNRNNEELFLSLLNILIIFITYT